MKTCNKCEIKKSFDNFAKDASHKDGRHSVCKVCKNTYDGLFRKINGEKIKQNKKIEYLEHKEKYLNRAKEHYFSNRKEKLEYIKKYKKNNKNKYLGYRQKERSTPQGKLNHNIGNGIRSMLRGNKNKQHWENIVGYTVEQLKEHLEKQFKQGMTWGNYGLYGWHVDHIIPKISFIYNSYKEPQFKECWSLDNLQPLWAEDNLKKASKVI